MNITKENISDSIATLTVKIEKNDYETSVNKALKDYQKKVNMPGFRPGKVPAGLVKKLYFKPVLADEVNKILSSELSQYIIKENLNILGDPLPNEEKQQVIDWDKDEDFEFVFDIGMSPDFEVSLDNNKKIPYYNIILDDKAITKQVEAYAGQFGENIKVEEAGEKDLLRGDFIQLDAEGAAKENGISSEYVLISIDIIKDEAIKKEITGKKTGESIVFDPLKAYENKHEVGHMLNLSHEEAEDIEGDFRFTINEVLRFQPAPINEELFKKAFGEETEVKTEEQFRDKLKSDLEKNLKPSSYYKFSVDTRDMLVETVEMKLPEEFLMQWVKTTNKEVAEDQIDADFPNFLKDLRWQLIRDRIAKDNEVKIDEEDIRTTTIKYMQLQFMRYGMFNMQDDLIEKYADETLKNETERQKMAGRALEEKVMAVIKSKINVEEKDISDEDFNKLMEK